MRIWLLTAAFMAGFAILIGGQASAQISLLGLKNSLVQFALDQISVPGELEITAERVEEPEDGSTSIVGLTVADAEGVWLRIGSLSLRWNARRILVGELDIESLVAADVEVLRQPGVAPEVKEDAEIAQTDDDPFDWPRAPLTVHLREMRLDRVAIAEGVIAGQSLDFDATGSLRDEGDEQSLALSLTRTDEVEGRIALEYLRTFDADTLKLDLAANEAAGGIVAEIAGFPNESASEVNVNADGPLSDWRLSLDAETEEVFRLTGQARVEAVERLLVDGDFELVPGPKIDPAMASVLGDAAELGFRIAEDEGGVVRIERGSLTSPHLTLDASGTYAKPTGAADLAVTLEGRRGLSVLAEGVEFEGFGFDGRVAGTPADLTAEGELTLDGLETAPADVGSARLATTVSVAGERVGFDVAGRVAGLRLDRLTPELLGDTELRSAGVFDAGVLALETLELGSPLLTLTASGEADTNASTAALDYALEAPRLGPIAAAYDVDAAGGLDVSGRVEGPFSAINIAGYARLAALEFQGESYGEVTLDHDVTVDETPGGRVSVTSSGSPFGPAEIATDFELDGQSLALTEMAVRALGTTIDGRATVALDTTLVEGDVAIRAPDLATLAPVTERFAGERLAGSVSGDVVLRPVDGRQDVTLDLALEAFRGFEAEVASLGIEGAVRDALGAPAADATLTLREARHPQGGVEAGTVAAEMTDLTGAPQGQVTLDLSGLSAAGAATVARLEGTADLSDLIAAPAAVVDLRAEGIEAPGAASVRAARLEADLRDLVASPSGDLRFRVEGIDAAGAASVEAVTGEGSFADATGTPSGRLTVETTRIAAGGATLPRAGLDATLSEEGTLDATLTAPSLVAGEVSVAAINVTARVAEALSATPTLDIRARTGEVSAAPLTLSAPTVTVTGPLSRLAIAADAAGEAELGRGDPKPVSLRLRAAADVASADISARLDELRASVGEAELALASPLRVRSSGGVTRAEGLDLALPGGTLTGAVASYPNGLGGDLDLAFASIEPLAAALADLGVDVPVGKGALDLAAVFDTRPGRANAEIALDARELRFDEALADIGALGVDLDIGWDGREGTADLAITGPFGDPVRVSASAPLRPTANIVPVVPSGGELEGSVVWSGDVGDLWALVPAPDHILDGRLDVDLALSGPIEAPRIGGSVAMEDGEYQNLEAGTILTHLTLGSTLEPDGGILLDLRARDGASGTVEARVKLDAETVDASVTARRAVLVRRDDVKAQISADIAARGPLAGPAVTGEIRIDRAEVRLVNTTPPSLVTLGDVRFKGDPEPEEEEPAGGAITLDVKLTGPQDIFVRGRGLDSEWAVDLAVSGTAAQPIVTGSVNRIRGQLELLGRAFDLERGEVTFSGGTEIDPALDVSLAHEREGFIGRIVVRGYASDPELAFESDPQVPEEEVLPRTLFGVGRQSLSPTEALLLANAVATLLDGSGGVIDDLRGAVGIDVLRIDEDEDGASVTVGKNLADGVFVGAKQPIDGGSATVAVEVDVFENVTVDAEIGQEEGSSIGLNWSKDF